MVMTKSRLCRMAAVSIEGAARPIHQFAKVGDEEASGDGLHLFGG